MSICRFLICSNVDYFNGGQKAAVTLTTATPPSTTVYTTKGTRVKEIDGKDNK